MTAIVQGTCPGCKKKLRIPQGWMQLALRCKHCHLPIHATPKGALARVTWGRVGLAAAYLLGIGVVVALSATQLPRLAAKPVEGPVATKKDAPADASAPAPAAKKTPVNLPSIEGQKLDVAGLAQRIDQRIQQRLDAESIPASPQADDAEFIRRAYLDVVGAIPPADKVAAFLDSQEPDKRAKLIDELLADPRYGRRMADIWSALLLPRNSDNRRLQPQPFIKWLEEGFNENKGWDKFVYELVTASGPQDTNGAVSFFLANATADKMVDLVTQQFMGVQLQCAQCHNHPFVDYKQTEYWGMAAFFLKVRPDNLNRAAKAGTPPGISEAPAAPRKPQRLPESAKIVPAKFLQGEQPTMSPTEPFRPVLAKWMTAPENPFFSRAMANRMWYHFFGRGIVNPVDDMTEARVPSHPELLQELAAQLTANEFDLKFLVRAICTSQAYQRTSKPLDANAKDDKLFSHVPIKVLSAEQLFDSLETVVGRTGAGAPGKPRKPAKPQKPGALNTPRTQFVAFFQNDEGADPTEYQAGIPQALRLMNSPQFNNGAALLTQAARAETPEKAVEQLYLATLSRRPTAAESERLAAHVKKTGDTRKAHSDILWAILNSSEFTLNH